jgi:diguanylate cyclase (GGDEF)-like protein/PAS domain S-box-containing protein
MSARILIVDDNATNLKLAASVLELEGFSVDQAGDAEQALAYLAATVPDLILMDIALPGMDGLSLTRQLKQDERLAHIPVVALTAFAMKGDEEKAREAGCAGYLTKPIDTREFGRQVSQYLAPAPVFGKVLIVDDHASNLRLLRAQLGAERVDVVEAEHGEQALERLAEGGIDAVISDILMPRMDGYRLCLEVRKDPRFMALPFVLYTSTYDSPADRALAEAAGADAYITKPAPVRTLLDALERARGRTALPQAANDALETPVLKQYSESLIRKLEEKSQQLSEANAGLSQTEARLSGLVESALDGIIAINEQQRIVLFNQAAERMFGIPRSQAMHRSLDDFIPARYRVRHRGDIRAFGEGDVDGRRMGARMVWALRASGEEFPVEAAISRLHTSHGWLFTVFLRDISERHRTQQALAASEARLRRMNRVLTVLSGINNLIVRAARREDLLREACRIAVEAGKFSNVWIGLVDPADRHLKYVAGEGSDATFHRELDLFLQHQQASQNGPWADALRRLEPVVVNELRDEQRVPASLLASGARSLAALPLSRDGRVEGVFVLHAAEPGFFDEEEMKLLRELASDISFALEHQRQAEQIHRLANYDVLTGLANRAQFTDRLAREMRAATEEGDRVVVVLLDLERFRRINETHGRAAGDELLRLVGARLAGATDTAARFGTDLFAVKLAGRFSVAEIAHAVDQLIGACFDASYFLAQRELRIGCRAGIAIFPDDGDDVEALVRNAEAASRRARMTSERVVFYSPELNARASEALALESRLRHAIDRREFVLHYQPKVDMVDRRLTGVEALIRWQDPQRGLVPPGLFIPVLEECGLIAEVGAWALTQALADQAAWRAEGLAAPRVAVNVSPLQLRRTEFASGLLDLVRSAPEARLDLEITESVIMEDVERNIAVLAELRDAGLEIAIDDFGTGYCSLAYIARLPISEIKIDRAFITGMNDSPEGLAIVSSIIALAHSLKLKVVAEGVETEAQAQLLRLLACDQAQGYLFCRPVPASAIAELLRKEAGNARPEVD